MQPVILVDAYNLIFRSHWAFQHLMDSEGRSTGVLYGFLSNVLRLKKQGHLLFCWDHGIPGSKRIKGWRQRLDPTYKANRTKSDDTAVALGQIPAVYRLLELMGFENLGIPGLEADDIIGLLCGNFTHPTLIYSTDQDLYQLLDADQVRVLRPRKENNKYKIIDQKQVESENEIAVSQWADFLALGGDTSDNIKAVKGWGPKKAIKLIQAGVNLLRPLEKQPRAYRVELQLHWEKIQMAYQMAAIPRSWADSRIRAFVGNYGPLSRLEIKPPRPAVGALDRFTSFCADHDLNEFLAQRHEFFT